MMPQRQLAKMVTDAMVESMRRASQVRLLPRDQAAGGNAGRKLMSFVGPCPACLEVFPSVGCARTVVGETWNGQNFLL